MRRYAPVFILLICAVVLVLGIDRLFEMRFESGDVYPPYSSLRTDPLGTMAFYEGLERLGELAVRRDYSTTNRLPESPETVYLHLAASMEAWRHISKEDFAEIDRFVNSGGRMVVTMLPVPAEIIRPISEKEKKALSEEKKEAEENAPIKTLSVVEHWGLNSKIINLEAAKADGYRPAEAQNVSSLALPDKLAWHSGMVFTGLDTAWNAIYVRDQYPVVVERKFGNGSVVFATDSYFLSNEAMRKDRHTDLLVWLIGPEKTVVFDEAHLGVTESANIATLFRRYRLHWLIASLLLIAALFVWKNTTSLIPVSAEERQPGFVLGKEAGEGFVSLLRRSIPAREVLFTCFSEWKKSVPHAGKHDIERRKKVEAAFEAELSKDPKDRDPVQTYQTISRLLQRRIP